MAILTLLRTWLIKTGILQRKQACVVEGDKTSDDRPSLHGGMALLYKVSRCSIYYPFYA